MGEVNIYKQFLLRSVFGFCDLYPFIPFLICKIYILSKYIYMLIILNLVYIYSWGVIFLNNDRGTIYYYLS